MLLWLIAITVVAVKGHNRGYTRVWMYPLSEAALLSKSTSPPAHVEPKTIVRPPPSRQAQETDEEKLIRQLEQTSAQIDAAFPQVVASPLPQKGHHQARLTPGPERLAEV